MTQSDDGLNPSTSKSNVTPSQSITPPNITTDPRERITHTPPLNISDIPYIGISDTHTNLKKSRERKPRNYDTKVHGNRVGWNKKIAIKALTENGQSVTQIAKDFDISRQTIHRVMGDERIKALSAQAVEGYKTALLGKNYETAYRAQEYISDEKLANSSALQLMTINAIGIDKARLMENQSTQNISVRSLEANLQNDIEAIKKQFDIQDNP